MKKLRTLFNTFNKKILLFVTAGLILFYANPAIAAPGSSGYEGGVAAEKTAKDSSKAEYEYQELLFLTGTPIKLSGTMTVTKKSSKPESSTVTYQYSLSNIEEGITLTRSVDLETTINKKDYGQTIEQTGISKSRKPVESVRIGSKTYTLTDYDFSRSIVSDGKPAVNYYAGNLTGRKTYRVSTGLLASSSSGTVTVDISGNIVGYDQYWGFTETVDFQYMVQSERKVNENMERWGGTAEVKVSSNSSRQIRYDENRPSEISFEGGYVQTRKSSSIMEYSGSFPEFSSDGISTDHMLNFQDTLKVETSPVLSRLIVPNINHLRGHWAEKDIALLYSLEVLKGDPRQYDPEEYMSRAEFADAVNNAAREVDAGNAAVKTSAFGTSPFGSTTKKTPTSAVMLFSDVQVLNPYASSINSVYTRKLMHGTGTDPNTFSPNESITVAQALTIFINALGLESMAPNPYAVTGFRDNDDIPDWARSAVYASERIGLAAGDERGYLGPNEPLTKARAAKFINKLINYMRSEMEKDYRDRIIQF